MSDFETDKAREDLITRTMTARTLPELDQAEEELHQWLLDHPHEQGMRDGFEQLSLLRDCAEWLAENPEEAERVESARRVSAQIYRAQTLDEISPARVALNEWLRVHPGDDRLNTEILFLDSFEEALIGAVEDDQHATRGSLRLPAHV